MRQLLVLVVSLCLFTLTIQLMFVERQHHIKQNDTINIHACVRTKESKQYIEEFIRFHEKQGINSYSFYDDSKRDHSTYFGKFESVTLYKHVNGVKIRNENHFIFECMVNAIISNKYDFVLNMDDDEFLFPTIADTTIAGILAKNKHWFKSAQCISNALYFFGTIKSNDTGLTTVDFVHRDRDVEGQDFMYYYRSHSNRIKKRTEKSIFQVPGDINSKIDMISFFGNNMKTGVMIHGYSMNCTKQALIKVAHYTRGVEDIDRRTRTFWTNVRGLQRRFNNNNKVKNYLKERNRTEFFDKRLHDITLQNLISKI